jgi:hypothetical protein
MYKSCKENQMKKLSALLLVSILIVFCSSCEKVIGEGPSVTENRSIANFSSVASSISADVYYEQSPDFKVEITAQQNIVDVIETHVINNELVIKFKDNVRVKRHENISVKISSPVTHGLRISGSGNLVVNGSINTTDMVLGLSGSGNINVHTLNSSSLNAGISGSGSITILNGTGTTENLTISGSGNMDLINIEASAVHTTTSGSGEMRVNASKTLDVTISGSGSVTYRGNPLVNTRISGSGRVIHQ